MGLTSLIQIAAATGGAAVFAGGMYALGAPLAGVGMSALLGGCSVVSLLALAEVSRSRRSMEARFDTLAAELVELRQHQADADVKMGVMEHRSIESPALVWRAATADIEILGSLVSDLAKAVDDHDKKLQGLHGPASVQVDAAPSQPVAPPPASWFEDEAELGFTADPPALPESVEVVPAASKAIMAELKTTFASALASGRLELCLQPYVSLPQRKVAGYEASLRLKGENGDLQSADELTRVAAATGMAGELDRILVERTGQILRVLRARERQVSVICGVSGDSILDDAFRSTLERVVLSDPKIASAITLAVPASDAPRLDIEGAAAVGSIDRLGVRLGIRRIPSLGFDVASMARIKATVIQVPATVLLEAAKEGGAGVADIHAADLAELLDRRGIALAITDVSSEKMVLDLLDLGIAMAQGNLFGDSRPVRPEILEPKLLGEAAAKPRPRTQASDPNSGTAARAQRQSFRSLLRRA